MLAKDIKPGSIVNYQGSPCLIEGVSVQTPSARGGATLYKFRARDLISRQKVDMAHKGTDALDDADFQRREVQLMYSDDEAIHLLDQQDYNQYSLPKDDVAEQMAFVTEDMQGMLALIYNDQCVGLQLPPAVQLKIVQCDPAVRGNSANARTKPATLETGFQVQVPDYMKEGEVIKVDTRTGEFLSRA